MKELIKINKTRINNEEVNSVNARELWEFLDSKQEFTHWIKNRIKKYNFLENEDYLVDKFVNKRNQVIETSYLITLDTAKELAMVENNEKGREIRKYFISIEKKYKEEQSKLSSSNDFSLIKALNKQTTMMIERMEEKFKEVEESNKKVDNLRRKVDFCEGQVTRAQQIYKEASQKARRDYKRKVELAINLLPDNNVTIRNFAKMISSTAKIIMGRNRLYNWLVNNNYIYRDDGSYTVYQKYITQELFVIRVKSYEKPDNVGEKHFYKEILITPKGQIHLLKKLANYEEAEKVCFN